MTDVTKEKPRLFSRLGKTGVLSASTGGNHWKSAKSPALPSPLTRRPRRLRRSPLVRNLVAEALLSPTQMMLPYFVLPGKSRKRPLEALPGIFQETADHLVRSVEADLKLGVKSVMLFGLAGKKDAWASGAVASDGPVPEAVRQLRKAFGDALLIAADDCLCAYTESGHCGILKGKEIDNDQTLPVLAEMALVLAQAGVDMVAPSDMMDGRVAAIRQKIDQAGFSGVSILAYSAKYASNYYGPFREAADSAPAFGDRKSYQMDFRNRREALKEVALDEQEGADIVMVKPALAYLDVIASVRQVTCLPVAAYNVSGEYAAVKFLARAGLAAERELVLENLCAIKRAGADLILTYHLRDLLKEKWL